MRQMARKLEKAEQKHDKETEELAKLRAKLDKMRANCSHDPVKIDKERGVFFCGDCKAILGYMKGHEPSSGDFGYEDEA